MTNILITGGAGFVGSHLAENLVNLGHNVTVIDNFSTGSKENIKFLNLQIINKDILELVDYGYFSDKIDKFDVVFHLAAQPFSKAQNNWFTESKSIFDTNVSGTHNLLRLINPNCHFIVASSASVYGEGRQICETQYYNPKSAYGYSKTIMEQVIKYSGRQYTIVRPGTIIGPRGRCFPNRVIWSLLYNKPCTFFNNGQVLRDIIDVQDVVLTFIEIMNQKLFGTFNLGSNTEISGLDLKNEVAQLVEENEILFKGNLVDFIPEDFVCCSTLNSNKLFSSLNWKPKYTLSESLLKIFDYYKNYQDIKAPPSWDSL